MSVEESPSPTLAKSLRCLVIWCPDWPVVAAASAADFSPLVPSAVFHANRVVACSGAARSAGVRRGMRRREAQGKCPELIVSEHDPDRDARLFEPVAAAMEELAPGVEIVRPGLVAVPARGPAGYFGSEEGAAERLVDQVSATGVESQAGVADGLFAAILAARQGIIVPSGQSTRFLAPMGIAELDRFADRDGVDRSALVNLLHRLGIRTLGAFAALPPADVVSRFGPDALLAHRAVNGLEERPLARRSQPAELAVSEHLDPPVDRVDAAAFVGKKLAQRLHDRLAERGLACTRLEISVRTEHGEELHRVWRCAEPLTPVATADRVRWQLDGWLNGRHGAQRPTAGVDLLSLQPVEAVDAGSLQLGIDPNLASAESDARAGRALIRVQGMLGPEAVLVGVLGGGRDVRDRVRLVPWGEQREPALEPDRPWPGRLPTPSPSVVPESPWSVDLLDGRGRPVTVTERLRLSAAPESLVLGGQPRPVSSWGGPWPVAERWWTTEHADTHVPHLQVVLWDEDGDLALLLGYQSGWTVRGVYW